MDKKGIAGLDTVKAVALAILVLGIIAIVAYAAINPIVTAYEVINVDTGSIVNSTTAKEMNVTNNDKGGGILAPLSGLRNCQLTVTNVINQTGGILAAPNYTVSGCEMKYVADLGTASANRTFWNVTGTYTYDDNSAWGISTNYSSGVAGFFTNVPTYFNVIAVLVIILLITIVIYAVMKLYGSASTSEGL